MKVIVKKIIPITTKQTVNALYRFLKEDHSLPTDRHSHKGFRFDSKHRRRQRPLPYMGFNAMEAIREKIYGAEPKDEPRDDDDTAMYRINLDGLRDMFGNELVGEDDVNGCPYQAIIDLLIKRCYDNDEEIPDYLKHFKLRGYHTEKHGVQYEKESLDHE